MRATPFHLSKQQYLRTPPCKKMCCSHTFFSNSPEATFAKCSKYALFLYKNTFFSKNICVFAFFVVPLHPIFAHSGEKGAIVYRLGQEIFIL